MASLTPQRRCRPISLDSRGLVGWRVARSCATIRYIADFNPRAAAILAQELREAAKNLRLFPHRGRPGQHINTRELVAVWPYVMVYRITRQTVEILRIWHGAQEREGE